MHKRWISLLQQICCTDYMHTCKYKQLKVIGFVLNRGSSLKLHSLLTPSRPVHPQHLQQTTQTHTHMNTLHISQPEITAKHFFSLIFSTATHFHVNSFTHTSLQRGACVGLWLSAATSFLWLTPLDTPRHHGGFF